MKLLVFAHVPPPHHGQSYMVKLMLEGLGGDVRRPAPADRPAAPDAIACYHVDCRYSEALEDIGTFRLGKFGLALRYCLEAIWCRFRHGVRALYYVPAPGKRAAMYRDWIVMLLCRPFFPQLILHWHAVGLGDWLEREGTWLERWLTHRLLGRPALSIVLAIPNLRDALWFRSRRVQIVANGIPDPCPDFATAVLPRRQARLAARRQLLAGTPLTDSERAAAGDGPEILRVLFLAHCGREKGLFDTLEGVAQANDQLRKTGSPLRLHLTMAGVFPREDEEAEYRARVAQPDLADCVTYVGFIGDAPKRALLVASDVLCFPTFYHAESFGLVVIEAMAAGLNVVTTRWRALPDLLPADVTRFVAPHSPDEVAAMLRAVATIDAAPTMRAAFLSRFTEAQFAAALRVALLSLAEPLPDQSATGR